MSPHNICNTITHYYCSECGAVDPIEGEPCRGKGPSYVELQGKLAALPPAMTWTTQKPTKPGWYWFKHSNIPLNPFVVRLTPHGTFTESGATMQYNITDYDGEWCGPMEPPQ